MESRGAGVNLLPPQALLKGIQVSKKVAYRQGDVLFYKVDEDSHEYRRIEQNWYDTIPAKNGYHVLAEGEVTGHAHRVKESRLNRFVRFGGDRFLDIRASKGAVVEHEEHNPIPLPQGLYEVVIERQYTIGGEAKQRVRAVYD